MNLKMNALLCVVTMGASSLSALAEPFSYQGKLDQAGSPASGAFDLQFALFDAGGIQIGSTIALDDVQVQEGLFSVELDFGVDAFAGGTGQELQISVREGASAGGYTALLPRTPINTVPVAQYALNQEVERNGFQLSMGGLTDRFLINPDVSMGMFASLSTDMQLNFNFTGSGGMYINGIFPDSAPFYGFARENVPVGRIQIDGDEMLFLVDSAVPLTLTQGQAQVNGPLLVDGEIQARMGSGFEQISPVAFGYVSSSGSSPSGTENYSAIFNSGTTQYEITIEGESFFFSDYTVSITPVTGAPVFATTGSSLGKLIVRIFDLNGNRIQSAFSFVVYRNEP
jgi:hypothetical protein